MAWAKMSVVLLLKRLASPQHIRYYGLFGMTTVWAVFSLFALAFHCQLPEPWIFIPSRCFSRGRLLYPVIALNILTDGVLAIFILPVIWKLNMIKVARITVMALFASRIM